MPQSLSSLVVHITYSTRQRAPVLTDQVRPKLYAYTAATLEEIDCAALKIGGYSDHLHLLIRLSRTRSLSDTIKTVKAGSSKWLKSQAPHLRDFSWQKGYAAFAIGRSEIHEVASYIENQEEHHRKKTFKEELLRLLNAHEMPYDENYLWEEEG